MAANGTAKPPRVPKYRLHRPFGRAQLLGLLRPSGGPEPQFHQ